MKYFCIIILIANFFIGCKKNTGSKVSFYYWKTIFQLSKNESEVLEQNNVTKLYIRYFDMTLKERKAIPKNPIIFNQKPQIETIVPVVFIKNEVMLEPNINLKELAEKTNNYIKQINTKYSIRCNEIQFDCDWSIKSKAHYFEFINLFKKITTNKISATIRLHQIKYVLKTGYPNVDKGILMYYNMGKIGEDSSNSIYNRSLASKYLNNIKGYPLKLNVALPIFSWGIQIRDHQVLALLNKVDRMPFENDSHFIQLKPDYYRANKSFIKMDRYFKTGDIVKVESISLKNIKEMANDLKENMAFMPEEIIFYDLDEFNTKNYTHEKTFLHQISSIF